MTGKGARREDQDRFDAVVIGSGFGGSVAAHRLAELGARNVLVLERGRPYPPGSFARRPWELRGSVWDPTREHFGLLELLQFKHVTSVVSAGLGGGSLIYANVMLKKPPDTFGADESNGWVRWPISYDDLEPGYEAVLAQLKPTEMPYGPHYVPKTDPYRDALDESGSIGQPAPIAVTFAQRERDGDPPVPGMPLLNEAGAVDTDNLHRRPRRTCTLVGECDFGCNEGAKNTLDYNFLSSFLGLPGGRREIRTCCDAHLISGPLRGGGYEVHYTQHAQLRAEVAARAREEGHETDLALLDQASPARYRVVRAKVVIVAAGTFGSTRLLLSSRGSLPRLSGQLGRGFSSNGDLLKFAVDIRRRNGSWRDMAPSRGPVITSYGHVRDGDHQTWIEDGGYPRGLEMLTQLSETPGDLWRMRGVGLRALAGRLLGKIGPDVIEALGDAHASASTLAILAMGRDVPGGKLDLHRGRLTLDWNPDGESDRYFSFVERSIRELTGALGGKPADRGWRRSVLPSRGLTAHPLGGCRMGQNSNEGVIDPNGEVFGARGLFVADGSVMPGPIGPNPSLTIGALSHLIAGHARQRI
jgi:cholesterol oxidase